MVCCLEDKDFPWPHFFFLTSLLLRFKFRVRYSATSLYLDSFMASRYSHFSQVKLSRHCLEGKEEADRNIVAQSLGPAGSCWNCADPFTLWKCCQDPCSEWSCLARPLELRKSEFKRLRKGYVLSIISRNSRRFTKLQRNIMTALIF